MTTTETAPVQSRHELYTDVLQHYARQMRLLDERDLAGYAATFTEDAEFAHTPGREPARTRAGILSDLEAFHEQFRADPMARRHHFSMVDVAPRDDGAIDVVCNALVVITSVLIRHRRSGPVALCTTSSSTRVASCQPVPKGRNRLRRGGCASTEREMTT